MILWQTLLIATVLAQFKKYIVGLKPGQNLVKREEGESEFSLVLKLVRPSDPDSFVSSQVSTITHVFRFGGPPIGFAIETTPMGILILCKNIYVAYCVLDHKNQLFSQNEPVTPATNQKLILTASWGLDRINQPDWPLDGRYPRIGNQGEGVTVFLLDSGVDSTKLGFQKRVIVGPYFLNGKIIELNTKNSDIDGHGTHCAGIIAHGLFGVAPNAVVVALKVTEGSTGYDSDIILALEHALEKAVPGKAVVSMSLGHYCVNPDTNLPMRCYNPMMQIAIENLIKKNIPVVAAAGNKVDNLDACYVSPAYLTTVFTVGAVSFLDEKLPSSNDGACVEAYAPGKRIESTHLGNEYVYREGTSAAAPFVTGVFASLLSTKSYPNVAALYKQVIDWALSKRLSGLSPGSHDRLLYVPY